MGGPLLLLLLPALTTAVSVDPETSRLLAEVNGGLVVDTADSDSVGQHSISHHDYAARYPAGLAAAEYGSGLPFGARTQPVTEHPLNEHFRYLEKARRGQYGDIYSKHAKLQYKPKYYSYPKHDGVKYQKPKYESLMYKSPKYESYKYEKPKYKSLKYKSQKYPRPEYVSHKYESHKKHVPKPVYEAPAYHQEYNKYVAPKSPHFFEPPPPHFGSDLHPPPHYGSDPHPPPHYGSALHPPPHFGSAPHPPPHFGSAPHPPPHYGSDPHPPRYETPVVAEADYPALPPPPTAALHHLQPPPPPPGHPVYPAAPESFHYAEEHHVTETYPVPAPYPAYPEPAQYQAYPEPAPRPAYPDPAQYPAYPDPAPRGHRAGKALDRFSFNPEPYIETIAIAYHENERNFGASHRQPKHHMPEYKAPRYPSPHKYGPPPVQEHAPRVPEYAPRAPEYAPRVPEYAPRVPEYGRHVPYAPPHVSEYVAPHAEEHVAPAGRGYGHLVGGRPIPQRTVTVTPYRVQVGTLYGLAAAGSSRSETVVKGDSKAEGREAKNADNAKDKKEKTTIDSEKDVKQA